jgi:hypothetical protein
MVQAPSKITLEEFLKLPETKPASEYIDGEIIQKPMPQGKHSVIQSELPTVINGILKLKRIGRAFLELSCTFGTRSLVLKISTAGVGRARSQDFELAIETAFLLINISRRSNISDYIGLSFCIWNEQNSIFTYSQSFLRSPF